MPVSIRDQILWDLTELEIEIEGVRGEFMDYVEDAGCPVAAWRHATIEDALEKYRRHQQQWVIHRWGPVLAAGVVAGAKPRRRQNKGIRLECLERRLKQALGIKETRPEETMDDDDIGVRVKMLH